MYRDLELLQDCIQSIEEELLSLAEEGDLEMDDLFTINEELTCMKIIVRRLKKGVWNVGL